jgi:flavin reductase (DIM6/NTAB) family NADH-FMN oxidoreductase RutF
MPWNKTSEDKVQAILSDLNNIELHVKDIAEKYNVSRWLVGQIQTKYLDKNVSKARISYWCAYYKQGNKNHMFNKTKDKHHNYKEKVANVMGYKVVEAPAWWEGTLVDSFRAYEHHIVCCETLGLTKMPPGHVVHHKDHNKLNNSADNLQLMTRAEHMSYHAKEYWKVQRLERKLVGNSVPEAQEVQEVGS